MLADDEQTARLRELHDAYVWAVNAAIAEGRDDLVAELADGYDVEALRIMTEGYGSACDRPGCVHAPRPRGATRHRRGWLRLLGIGRTRH
jgi:hypothetical protein